MIENLYEKLRQLFNLNPMGCPPAPEIIEILKILFTEEEARIALGLGFLPLPSREIAHRAGVPPEVAEKHLESLANKGVVFAREKGGSGGMHSSIRFICSKIHTERAHRMKPSSN
jgi:hypothetical protein